MSELRDRIPKDRAGNVPLSLRLAARMCARRRRRSKKRKSEGQAKKLPPTGLSVRLQTGHQTAGGARNDVCITFVD